MSVQTQTVSAEGASEIEVEPLSDEGFMAELQQKASDLKQYTHDQMMSFNRLVVGGVTLAVGILVYNEIIGALPTGGNEAINQTPVTSTVESAFVLAPVALLVIIAAVILANVSNFGRGGGGM
jgi:hypothetical protein